MSDVPADIRRATYTRDRPRGLHSEGLRAENERAMAHAETVAQELQAEAQRLRALPRWRVRLAEWLLR